MNQIAQLWGSVTNLQVHGKVEAAVGASPSPAPSQTIQPPWHRMELPKKTRPPRRRNARKGRPIDAGKSIESCGVKRQRAQGRKYSHLALLRYVLKELERERDPNRAHRDEQSHNIHGCLACRECSKKKDGRCAQTGDMGNVYMRENAAGGRHSSRFSDICHRHIGRR